MKTVIKTIMLGALSIMGLAIAKLSAISTSNNPAKVAESQIHHDQLSEGFELNTKLYDGELFAGGRVDIWSGK